MAEGKVKTIVRFYKLKNRLKEKTAGLSGEKADIPTEALAAAEAALQEMSEDYPDWVAGLIDKLRDAHRRCVDTPEERKMMFEDIHQIAHDMTGQGGTFGYPLISQFAESLSGFANAQGSLADNHVELIKAHVDAMRAVINGRVKGDGGEVGAELAAILQKAIEKYK